MKEEVLSRLRRLRAALDGTASWDQSTIEAALKNFARDEGVGMGQIGPAARIALTGGAPAPDLAQTFFFLGKDEALGRLADRTGG